MKVLSLNIRGIQDRPKHAKLWSLIRVEGVVMCFFQKTMCSMLFDGILKSLWGVTNFDWMARSFVGQSGGILCLWKKRWWR